MRRVKGSVRQDGSSRKWVVQVTVPSTDGKQHRLTRRVKGSRADAERVYEQLCDEADILSKSLSSPTLRAFWPRFEEHCATKGLSPTTIDGYRSVWRNHIEPSFGDRRLGEVAPAEVSEWLAGMSYGAARHSKAVLSAIYAYAEELGAVEHSVMRRKYTMPSKDSMVRPNNQTVYTWDEMERIGEACRGESWEPAYILMAFGGLRRSEAVGVRPGDIHDDGGWAIVQVRRAVVKAEGRVIVKDSTKTDDSRRDVPIAPPWGTRLLELRDEAVARGDGWMLQDGDSVADPDVVSVRYGRWFATQPFKRIPLRNLRNSYTTAMISRGADSAMVSKLTGHASIDVTYRNYLRPSAEDFKTAISSADANS